MLRPGLTRRLEGSAGARLGAIRDLPIASKIVLTFLLLLGLVAGGATIFWFSGEIWSHASAETTSAVTSWMWPVLVTFLMTS